MINAFWQAIIAVVAFNLIPNYLDKLQREEWDRKYYEAEIHELLPLAKLGDPHPHFNLARIYSIPNH